ncbi:MAG: hypothetical protein IKW62_01655 [Clostridia bacterium]|nr:hypothetical protein [Clostridia bacterium]
MKKFYEKPVVEITVFDVEDVITTSAVIINSADAANAEDVADMIAKINGGTYSSSGVDQAEMYSRSTYGW